MLTSCSDIFAELWQRNTFLADVFLCWHLGHFNWIGFNSRCSQEVQVELFRIWKGYLSWFIFLLCFFYQIVLYSHFKCHQFSQFPLQNPLLSPFPAPQPTHSHSLNSTNWGIEPSQDLGPLLPLMTNQAILSYIYSQSHMSHHVFSLIGGLVPRSSGCTDQFILMFLLWGFRPLQLLGSLAPSLGTLCSTQWLTVSIHFCICQALAEPHRRQLYQAPVSSLLLATALCLGLVVEVFLSLCSYMKQSFCTASQHSGWVSLLSRPITPRNQVLNLVIQ